MKIRNVIKDYFECTQREFNGFAMLALFVFILSWVPRILDKFIVYEPLDFPKIKSEIDDYYAEMDRIRGDFPFDPNTASRFELKSLGFNYDVIDIIMRFRKIGGEFYKKEDFALIEGLTPEKYQAIEACIEIGKHPRKWNKKVNDISPFNFNPNTISQAKLLELGLPEKTVSTIMNYRNKNGKFYKPTDFLYIYGVTKKDFKILEPYIQLGKSKKKYKKYPKYKKYANNSYKSKWDSTKYKSDTFTKRAYVKKAFPKEVVSVDINQSTPERWQLLYGIGPKLSERITKFRDKLGGFTSIDQVGMVYGLQDSTFQSIKGQLVFSPIFRKLDINGTVEELKAHPMISWKKARILVNYRENHGDFEGIEGLRKVGIFEEGELDGLRGYLIW